MVGCMLTISSCSDHDEPTVVSPDPGIEDTESGQITSFSIGPDHFNLSSVSKDLTISLMSEDGEVFTYPAHFEIMGNIIRFYMEVPKDQPIADGNYIMTLSQWPSLGIAGRLLVTFKNGKMVEANAINANYPLKGSGTDTDPYIIASSDDFVKLVKAVNSDTQSYAAGLMFKQTADISYEDSNTLHGYVFERFAGIYDGGGKAINLNISSVMSGAALFGSLTGSASISNLTFTNSNIKADRNYCGIVAGKVTGNVSFENIDINGGVTGDAYVGALAGYISKGNVLISKISVAATVIGRNACIGGLVGKIDNTKKVIVKDCSVSSPVAGVKSVGGAFGEVNLDASSEITFDGLKLFYPYSTEAVKGASIVGGFVGRWHWVNGNKLSISKAIEIDLSVEGSQSEVGGIFGTIEGTSLNMEDFLVGETDKSSQMSVHGIIDVGGLIGSMTNSSLCGSQIFNLKPKDNSAPKIPNSNQFKSSFNGSVKGINNVGGLVGSMKDSKLTNISSGAKIADGGENIGGLVGYFATSSTDNCLSDCVFTGEINASSAENTGGILGYCLSTKEGLIEDCINYGTIVGGYYTGGIIGYVRKEHDYSFGAEENVLNINWAVNATKIEGSFNVGGIVGRIYSADTKLGGNYIEDYEVCVSNCMNATDVIARGGNSEEALGGIVGRTGALTLVSRCANHGYLEGRGQLHAIGGIVGRLGQDSNVMPPYYYNSFAQESVNTASINSTNAEARIGGIVGYGEEGGYGTNYIQLCGVVNCRNSGKIIPDQNADTGGILGFGDNSIRIASNFNRGKVEHGNAILGTQKTNGHQHWGYNYTLKGCGGSWPIDCTLILSDSGIKNQNNFIDFDFDTIWEMTSDGPNLRNNYWRDPSTAVIKK